MKWIGNRISFVDEKNYTTIVIVPEIKAWQKSVMGAWVGMWLAIGVTVLTSYFTFKLGNQEKIAVWVFMTFWAYFAYRVTRTFLWLMWGKELIKIDEAAFYYKKSIGRYGKSIPYYLENIKKMVVDMPKTGSIQYVWEASPWILGGERLAFDYGQKVIRFGRKIEEKEAKLLFNVIVKTIEDQLKRRKAN
ncbi:MAG: hypothetical protein V4638_03855 [Bacteroidota bacterium]